ncbi:hypothetical protein [Microbispora sp. CA-102843]|uniref:hypothetical protein n=1 Tax=Microbispora sp. CA-102843 TaxID=3239952 RepID=UPI003D940CF7
MLRVPVSRAAVSLVAVSSAAESPVAGPRTAGSRVPGEAFRAGRGRCASRVPVRPAVSVESLPPRRADEGGRDREEGFAVRAERSGDRDAPVS